MSKTHHLPRRPHGVKAWLRRTAAIAAAALVGTTALVASGITSTPASAIIPGLVAQAGTWYETAFAVWQGASDGDYRAYVQLSDGFGAYDWRTGDPIADPDWDMAAGW
ncbi:MAG: hypothetical protein FWG25_08685, partial [Promicromonosporaceae bacterium]|nr:hypothetical protein [Promicromonosporaceae bacterium]